MNPDFSTRSCYLLSALGIICSMGLGLCLYCIAELPEGMYESNSPMVGIAPFLNVAFIFVFAWLSYAFIAAACSCKRESEGRAPLHRFRSACWFALAVSIIAALYFVCMFYAMPTPKPEYIGMGKISPSGLAPEGVLC